MNKPAYKGVKEAHTRTCELSPLSSNEGNCRKTRAPPLSVDGQE